jgi:hypothetical protein
MFQSFAHPSGIQKAHEKNSKKCLKKKKRNKAKLIIKEKEGGRLVSKRDAPDPKNDDVDVNAKNPGAFAGADESHRVPPSPPNLKLASIFPPSLSLPPSTAPI